MMVGSDAVVFLPEPEASEDDSEPAGVGEHILGSKVNLFVLRPVLMEDFLTKNCAR